MQGLTVRWTHLGERRRRAACGSLRRSGSAHIVINTRRVGAAWRAAAHARCVALAASRAPIPAYYRQREVAAIVLELDVAKDPKRARLSWASHLARGKWMTESGYRYLLRGGRPN